MNHASVTVSKKLSLLGYANNPRTQEAGAKKSWDLKLAQAVI